MNKKLLVISLHISLLSMASDAMKFQDYTKRQSSQGSDFFDAKYEQPAGGQSPWEDVSKEGNNNRALTSSQNDSFIVDQSNNSLHSNIISTVDEASSNNEVVSTGSRERTRDLSEFKQRRKEVKDISRQTRSAGSSALYCSGSSVLLGVLGLMNLSQAETCDDPNALSAAMCLSTATGFAVAACNFFKKQDRTYEALELNSKLDTDAYVAKSQQARKKSQCMSEEN